MFGIVIVYVGGFWIISLLDVVDVFLFRFLIVFFVWGVIVMWVVFVIGLFVVFCWWFCLKL